MQYEKQHTDYEDEIQRILQNNDIFQPLRIHFDTTDLDRWSLQSTETSQQITYLKSYVLPEMARIWSSGRELSFMFLHHYMTYRTYT